MDESARIRRDVAWNLVPVALLAGVGLGLNFMIGGWWGPTALGVFNLVTLAFFALAVIGAGGIQYSVLRAVAEQTDDESIAAVVVGALVPNLILAIVSAIACVLLAPWVGRLVGNPDVARGMLWVAPGVFCFAINKVLMGIVNGLRRMRHFAVYTSLRYILIAVGIVAAHELHADAVKVAAIWTFAEAVLLVVLLVELFVSVRLRRASAWRSWSIQHLRFGSRGLLATLAFEVNSKLDVWLLAVALPEKLVGIYALASSLFEGAAQLGIVVQSNLNPILARDLAAGRHDELRVLVRRTRRWFVPLIVAACVVSVVLYPYIVPVLTGDARFAQGSQSFTILMIGLAIASPWLPFNQLLLMANAPGWHTLYVLLWFGIMFAANAILIPIYGMLGAAIGTAIAFVSSAALLHVLVRIRLKLAL